MRRTTPPARRSRDGSRTARPRGAGALALLLALGAAASGGPARASQEVPAPSPAASSAPAEPAALAGGDALPPPESRHLVLVVDTSASMAANDPTARIRRAVGEVVDGLPGRDVVGLVTFDTGSRVVAPLRRLDEPGARRSLTDAVAALRFDGRHTDIAEAVERALYELTRPGREGGPRLIVLVTDGLIDTGDAAEDAQKDGWLREDLLPSCREEGIRIFSVAFTEAADYELLRTMSTRTGGGYYRALTPADVPGIFAELERALDRPPPKPPAEPPPPPPPVVPAEEIEQAVEKAVRQVEAERPPAPPPAAPVESGPSTAFLAALVLLAAAALVVAALALRRVRRADREALPLVQARLHDLESGHAYELSHRVTRIGRAPDGDVVIDSPTISGQHALIEARDGIYYLVDLRSTNGTYVNEHRVERETVLRKGDVVRFDRFKYAFDGLELDDEATQVAGSAEQTVVRVSPWADRDDD